MRTIIFCLSACLIISCVVIACHKTSYGGDAMFITGTETDPATTLTVDTNSASTAISVTSSALAQSDINISLQVDTNLIAEYNTMNGTSYVAPPSGSYSLSGNTVTIKSGTNVSNTIDFTMKSDSMLKDGVAYMVPVTVSGSSGNLRVLNASRTVYVVLNKVIRSTVASIANNYFVCDFSKNNAGLNAMTNITYEARILVNKFQGSSPFISTVMGIEEQYLLRFGDVTISNNQLQQSGVTSLTVATPFATGIWYHIALTYDGTTEKIYVNGELAASQAMSRTIDLTSIYSGGFHLGFSAGGRYLNGMISECRVWSKALSQVEIVNGMCGVDPASPGLVAYWKLNEGQGDTAYDISGNHHDAVASHPVTWIPDVRCN